MTSVHDSRLDAFRVIVQELREHLNENRQGIEMAQRDLARIRQDFQQTVSEFRKDVQNANRPLPEFAEMRAKAERAIQAVAAFEACQQELQHAGMPCKRWRGFRILSATPTAAGTIFNDN